MGMDSLLAFDTWHKWQDILQLCHLVVCKRPLDSEPKGNNLPPKLAAVITSEIEQLSVNNSGYIYLAETSSMDISATKIRSKLKHQQDICADTPKAVANYINQHQLYR